MGKLKIWSTEEDSILIQVSNTSKSKKWKKASQELKKLGFERSDVQCRQRFINHLDPGVNKEGWSDEELEILYNKYGEYGNKWFLLQKHLPGRTQTKIKNYFYGRIRFFLKLIVKITLRANTGFIGDVKTQTLLDIYQAKSRNYLLIKEFQGFSIIHKTIKRLKYKIEKKSCVKFIKENRQQFQFFAKFFIQKYSKSGLARMKQSEDEGDSSYPSGDNLIKPTRVSLVSSTGGIIINVGQQKQYLLKMSEIHLNQYNKCQRAIDNLIKQEAHEEEDIENISDQQQQEVEQSQ